MLCVLVLDKDVNDMRIIKVVKRGSGMQYKEEGSGLHYIGDNGEIR